MNEEEIIERIISRHPELSKSDILERLMAEKKKTGGLFSDKILLRMVAAELGVEIQPEETSKLALSIKNIVPNLSDVSITGRVVAIFPPKTFTRGRGGRIASLLIADQSGMMRVVLWNDKTCLIESGIIKVGQIVRFSHGYTKEDRSGKVELHIGDKGEIEINPRGANPEEYPTVSKFTAKIGEISEADRNKRVSVKGTVKDFSPASTFEKPNSKTGKVLRILINDETGEIPVVVWNEKADDLEKTLKKNVELQIINAKVKKAVCGGMEIHVDAGAYVETVASVEDFLKIAELKEGLNHVNVKGKVATKPMLRDVKTLKGEFLKLATFELKDESGRIWVSAWRKHAETASKLKVGDKLMLKDVYVKRGFGDQPEISTKNTTFITVTDV
ncbi:MAG: OB-fold nucleic acid binding domain-containing protein [Candidatus Bathyarchaeia archaeon]